MFFHRFPTFFRLSGGFGPLGDEKRLPEGSLLLLAYFLPAFRMAAMR